MPASFIAEKSIDLAATPERVWAALVTPETISRYMFGARVSGDWKKGGEIVYAGEWEGAPYEDRGAIVEIDPPRLLVIDYWSAMSGMADTPESRQRITYVLEPKRSGTRLVVTHANNPSREAADAAAGNWTMTLETLKGILAEATE